jgi:hypothetical protein
MSGGISLAAVIALLETRLGLLPPDPRPHDRPEPGVRMGESLA